MELAGRTVLLTGATGGIGQAIARALHAQGAVVKISGRRAEVLEQLAAELGDRVEVLPADLSSSKQSRQLARDAGEVDVFVANAGLPGTGRLFDYSEEELDRVLAVNLRSPIQMTQALLPGMLERGAGHFVYISSIAGKVPTVGASLYAASKFGLRGFSRSLHEDLRGTGVGATAIFPGFIAEAGLWGDTGLELPRGSGRLRTPDEVAQAVLKGIATNRAEIDVGTPIERLGGRLFGPAPGLVTRVMRAAGGEKLSAAMADAQREKR
jgi:short-subunit dehydrogenase